MATPERIPEPEEHKLIPMPGSIPHLEFLVGLESSDINTLQELQGFLFSHYIPESFARLIMKHRTAFPLVAPGYLAFDSRSIPGRSSPESMFRGALYIDETFHRNTLLTIHGRPNRGNYTYDLSIPLDSSLKLDHTRPLEAYYAGNVPRGLKDFERGYNSIAFPEYKQDKPAPFVCATQEAAYDLARLIRYANGETSLT